MGTFLKQDRHAEASKEQDGDICHVRQHVVLIMYSSLPLYKLTLASCLASLYNRLLKSIGWLNKEKLVSYLCFPMSQDGLMV